MNGNYQNDALDVFEIDLVDMMFYLLGHWKSLLITLVVGALLGAGIYALKLKEPDEEISELAAQYVVEENDLKNMETASEYRRFYETRLEYKENSILMQMDSNRVYEGTLCYYISAGDNTEYISLLYQYIVNSDDVLNKIKTVAGLDCDSKYLKEIINCTVSRGEDAYVNGAENFFEYGNYVTQSVILNYKIAYPEQSKCAEMLSVLEEEVEKLHEECRENYDNYSMRLANNSVVSTVRNDILNAQSNCTDMLIGYRNNIEKYESALSDDAFSYYETEYLGKSVEQKEKVESEEIVQPNSQISFAFKSLIKWIVSGMFVLLVCWGGMFVLRYMLSRQVRTPLCLEKNYHLAIIGRINDSIELKSGIDGCIQHLREKHVNLSDNVEYVIHAILSLGKRKVVFCGNDRSPFVADLISALQQNQMDIFRDGFVYQSKKSLERAKESDGVILLVALNATTHEDIQRELAACHIQNIPVLGAIIVG